MASPTSPSDTDSRIPPGSIVAGLDGTPKDAAVVEFAALTAVGRRRPLHLVHARESIVGLPPSLLYGGADSQFLQSLEETDASGIVEAAVRQVQRDHPDLHVTTSTPAESAIVALDDASRVAALVVVGIEPTGVLEKVVLGATALVTAMHAHCPVAVIPLGRPAPTGEVVVAVDGSPDSARAAEYGFEEARARSGRLVVVATWRVEIVGGYVVTTQGSPQWREVHDRYVALATATLGDLPDRYPDVEVRIEAVQGAVVPTLVEASERADVLVMGSRGRGGIAGMLLGSVSHGVLQRARCPVVVVKSR